MIFRPFAGRERTPDAKKEPTPIVEKDVSDTKATPVSNGGSKKPTVKKPEKPGRV